MERANGDSDVGFVRDNFLIFVLGNVGGREEKNKKTGMKEDEGLLGDEKRNLTIRSYFVSFQE